MKYLFISLFVFALSCKENDNNDNLTNAPSAGKPPISITTGFSTGSTSITNIRNAGYATGYSYTLDLSAFDSIVVSWKTTFSPFPAPAGKDYKIFLAYDYNSGSSTTFYDNPPTQSQQSFSISIPSYRLVNRTGAKFRLIVGCTSSPSSGSFTGYDFSIAGWKP